MTNILKFVKGSMALLLVATIISGQLVGARSAFAAGYLTLNSFSGTPGVTLTASGAGWTASDTVSVYAGSASGTPLATGTVAGDSGFSVPITIPASEPQGPLSIIGVDNQNGEQETNSYYVVPFSPAITDTESSHAPYATVQVHGTGFAPNEGITLSLAGATASSTADATGAFSGTIVVPIVSSNLYHLQATGNSSNATTFNYFWIDTFWPNVSPSAWYVMPGAQLSFTGSGFAPGETINVTQSGTSTQVSSFVADGAGAFTNAGAFAVPASDHGKSITFTLTGTKSNQTASTNVTIGDFYAYASPSSYYLLPGQTETFSGGGFAAGETVDVFVNGSTTAATHITTDQSGSFSGAGSVLVPFSSGSTVSFRLVGESSNAVATASTGVGQYWPSLTPSSWYVSPNSTISVAGSGFAPNESVNITVSNASSTTATVNAMGNFTAPVTIPFGTSALITGTGQLSQASTSVSIGIAHLYPNITPSSWFVYPGGQVSYTGTGFAPNESVNVIVGTASSTVTADANGAIHTATTTVPFSSTGSLAASFTGNQSGGQSTVTIAVGTLAPYLSASSYYALPGSTVTITGNNFAPGETVAFSDGIATTTATADGQGTASAQVTLPFGHGTSLTITAKGQESGASSFISIAYAAFIPQVAPSTYYTLPGTSVSFNGSGYAPNEKVDVAFNSAPIGTVTADANGAFMYSYTIPFGSSKAAFSFIGEMSNAGVIDTLSLATYSAYITLSSYYGQSGQAETISGSGFASNEPVSLIFNGMPFATSTANASGTISYMGSLPYSAAGKMPVGAVGVNSGAKAGSSVTVAPIYPDFELGSYAGAPGSTVTIIGSGYLPNEIVDITTDRTGSTPVTTGTTDSTGRFGASFVIPANWTEGTLVITANGEHSFTPESITYYVTGS